LLYFIIYCLYEQGTELANIFLINYLQFVNHPVSPGMVWQL